MKIVAIDFETADQSPDSACALGLASIENGNIAETHSFLIRPPRQSFEFTYLHGISWTTIRQQPVFAERIKEFEQFVEGASFLAAHNAAFDRKVLISCYAAAGRMPPDIPFLCTVKLARYAWDIRPTRLPDVCAHLGISLNHHEAASDALACAEIAAEAIRQGVPVDRSKLGSPSYSVPIKGRGRKTASKRSATGIRKKPGSTAGKQGSPADSLGRKVDESSAFSFGEEDSQLKLGWVVWLTVLIILGALFLI